MGTKKLIKALLNAVFSMALTCVVLLLFITLAKYSDEIEGYVDFDAGRFNATISSTPVVVTEDGVEKTIEVVYYAQNFKPGMYSRELDPSLEEDTAATTKFRISNGNSAADAATMELEYTVRIRTSNSLPLKYTLKSIDVNSVGSETITYNEPLGAPKLIQEDNSEARYEYYFNEPIAGEINQSTKLEEVTFKLKKGTDAEPVVYRDHELIAEWSTEGDLASSEYMKEVEIVEISVSVLSINQSADDDYTLPDNPSTGDYAEGIMVILPEAGKTEKDYNYEIDLRSFQKISAEGAPIQSEFGVTLHNGFGLGLGDNPPLTADYDLQLKVPAEIIEATGDAKWSFGLYSVGIEETATNLMSGATVKYRVYNEKEGTYVEYDSRASVPAFEEPLYKLYYVYTIELSDDYILNYQKLNTANTYDPIKDMHRFKITATNFAEVDDSVAFLNKLELTVKASFGPIPSN